MSSAVNPPITQLALPVESTGDGIDLVLLHGWGLHSEFFRPWLPLLVGQCRVHLMDLPGHGLSPPCSPYSLESMAGAIAHSMRGVADRYAVAGWSLGGAVAQRLTIDFPQTVTHLVTIASTPRFLRADDWPHAATAHALELLHDGLKRDYAGTLAQFFELNLAAKYRGLADELATLARRRPAAFIPSLDEGLLLTRSIDLRSEAAAIRAPVLAISGRLDRLSYSQSSAWLARACRGTHLDLPHAAHIPHLSNPVECAAALIEHVQKTDRK